MLTVELPLLVRSGASTAELGATACRLTGLTRSAASLDLDDQAALSATPEALDVSHNWTKAAHARVGPACSHLLVRT